MFNYFSALVEKILRECPWSDRLVMIEYWQSQYGRHGILTYDNDARAQFTL